MDWVATICLISLNIVLTQCRNNKLEDFLGQLNRRYIKSVHPMVGQPSHPDRYKDEDSYSHLGSSLLRLSPSKFELEHHMFTPRPKLYRNRRSKYLDNQHIDSLSDFLRTIFSGTKNKLQQKRNSLRRNHYYDKAPILGVPRYPSDLPVAESIQPGHTLLRPAQGMLTSSVKFPHLDTGLVYGNEDNIGITYGKDQESVKYTEFRKSGNLLDQILNAVESINKSNGNKKPALVFIDASRSSPNDPNYQRLGELMTNGEKITEDENEAGEILDDVDAVDRDDTNLDFRKKSHSNYRNRPRNVEDPVKQNCSHEDDKTSSSSSGEEKNPGNPYTIHKNKYKTNWLWNIQMDGDHMNINPYGPHFGPGGPSGADLFFGRKWWYFNQDDYKPLRR